MDALFLQLVNMSIAASWLIMAVLLVRLVFRKVPKALLCILWAIVAARLICPISLESVFSLIPSVQTIPQEILLSPAPQIDSGVDIVDRVINPIIVSGFTPEAGVSINPMQVFTTVAAYVWLVGLIAMLGYALVSYILVYRQTRMRLPLEQNVYLCDTIHTPFIFGIIRPQIYLPSSLSETDAVHVLAHERAHLKRRDHWWKPLGFALLSIYWFNPLLWLAYILLCRDIEGACDEHVLSRMSKAQTAAYTEALLHCSAKKRLLTVCPLAFGETNAKARIKHALSFKKPTTWLVIVSVALCMMLSVCFLTNPMSSAANGAASELENVSVTVEELGLSDDHPHITVKWQNKSDRELIYGEAFRLYRLENGQLVDTCLQDEYTFAAVAYSLTPYTAVEKTYDLSQHDLSQNGFYRFESTVHLQAEEAVAYTLWVNFEVKNNRISLPPIGLPDADFACSHQWLYATCTTPQTCMLCQETEGQPNGHDWADATCEAPQICRVCAVTEGDALGHAFENVTCTDGGACVRCGKKGTKTLPHTYSEATCTADAACTACGAVGKKALGHDFTEPTCTEDGICSRCKEIGDLAYGHSYTAATCTQDAVCTVCHTVVENATGHIYSEATCTTDGTCIYCGDIGSYAFGHFFAYRYRTCTEPAHCEYCGETIGEPYTHMPLPCNSTGYVCGLCHEYIAPSKHQYSRGYCVYCHAKDPDVDMPYPYL